MSRQLATGVLSGRNSGVARMFLESLWRALIDDAATAPDKKHSGGRLADLRDALSDAFSRGPTRPLYVQTLQGFAIVDRGSWVPPDALVVAATASGSLQSGALQVLKMTDRRMCCRLCCCTACASRVTKRMVLKMTLQRYTADAALETMPADPSTLVVQLEQQLMFARPPAEGGEPPAQRHRSDKGGAGRKHPLAPDPVEHDAGWEALAEVYNNMGEDDLMRVVVTQHLARRARCSRMPVVDSP